MAQFAVEGTPRCGVTARVQRAEQAFAAFSFAPLHAARSSQRDDPTFKSKKSADHLFALQVIWDSWNSSLRLSINDGQPVSWRISAAGLGLRANGVIFVVELETIIHGVYPRRHRHITFPTILHQRLGTHGIRFAVDEDRGLNALPAQRLLLGIKGDFNRIKVVWTARLLQR